MPSMMSTRTTSPSSLSASLCAAVAPTLPAPTTVIFFLAIVPPRVDYRAEILYDGLKSLKDKKDLRDTRDIKGHKPSLCPLRSFLSLSSLSLTPCMNRGAPFGIGLGLPEHFA